MDRGLKNENTALSHRGVLIRLHAMFLKVENFWNQRCLDLWVSVSKKQKKKAGTINTYLGSICFFFKNYELLVDTCKELELNMSQLVTFQNTR